MADTRPAPVARSSVRTPPPVKPVGDWEVSARRSAKALRLSDLSPLAKVHLRAQSPNGSLMDVPFGRAQRDQGANLVIGEANLVVGEAPGEWLLLGPCGQQGAILARLEAMATESFTTVTDLTHGYALLRLSGPKSRPVLSKICPVDLSNGATPNGRAFRALLAGLLVGVVRDDLGEELSYLCYCDRSSGQYLFDVIMDAGREFDIDVDGYPDKEI